MHWQIYFLKEKEQLQVEEEKNESIDLIPVLLNSNTNIGIVADSRGHASHPVGLLIMGVVGAHSSGTRVLLV